MEDRLKPGIHDISAACRAMAHDALHGLALDDALSLIEAHLGARPGIDGSKLEAFADRIRRQAWDRQRKAA